MSFTGQLRPFQQFSHDRLYEWGQGLLAITMGGGKTLVAISIIERLLDEEEAEAGLIIVPSGVKRQWVKRLEEFAPGSHVMLIDGTPAKRREQYRKAVGWAEYIVLGYSQAVDDYKLVRQLPMDFIVCDEIQALKNPTAKRTVKVNKLLERARFRYGLSGQPLENHAEDIFHICAAIDPTVLGRPDIFDKTFIVRNRWGRAVRFRNLPLLKRKLTENIMVRFSREDIADQLPDREFASYEIDFDRAGAKLYRTIAKDLLDALAKAKGSGSFDLFQHYTGTSKLSLAESAIRGRIMARLTCLRMLCDHPELLRVSASLYAESQTDRAEERGVRAGSAYAHELLERGLLDAKLGTPKMAEAVDLIVSALADSPKTKVVLFSFFKHTLPWIEEAVREEAARRGLDGVGIVLYHGDLNSTRKEEARDAFNNDPDVRVFLSTDAGGAGVDLPAGNIHINYDLPFSAGQLEQRNARTDRISSEHEKITIIDLLMAGSIEERYESILGKRIRLAQAVVDGKAPRRGELEFDTGTLREFLETSEV